MFQLFKERNFNEYLGDTVTFFKSLGKHYFKNYFIINGGLLLLVTVIVYFFSKIYFEFIVSKISRGSAQNFNNMPNYLQENLGLVIAFGVIAFIVFVLISIIQFTFPVVYMDLYDQTNGANFTSKEIVNGIKSRAFKIFKFGLGSLFVFLPVFMIVFFLNILLCIVIIGFPLLLITIPAMMSFVNLSFYFYMNSDEGFFQALSDGFHTLFGKFWPIVFSTLIILIFYYMINLVFTMIPYMFGVASFMTTISSNATDKFSTLSVLMSIVMVVSIIASYILNNLILVNQGLIYYSHVENNENKASINSIDLIGTDSE